VFVFCAPAGKRSNGTTAERLRTSNQTREERILWATAYVVIDNKHVFIAALLPATTGGHFFVRGSVGASTVAMHGAEMR
jgi:hypothetical protein